MSVGFVHNGDVVELASVDPSHGPVFRNDRKILQGAIDRLSQYQHMADFGTCTVSWPLQEQYENDILA